MSRTEDATELPTGWETRRGSEIAALIGKGSSPRWQGFAYADSGMLFVTSENVRDGYLDVTDPKFLPLEFHEKLARTQLRRDDILVNLVGASIGRSCRVAEDLGPANVNQAVAVLRFRDAASAEFIAYFLQAPSTVKRILDMQADAARPNISLGNLRDFAFLLPPLPEQRAIATALSDVDALVAALDQLIAKKRDLKAAMMQQLLTGQRRLPGFTGAWEAKRLGDLSRFRAGTYLAQTEYRDGPVEVHGAGNIMGMHNVPNIAEPISVIGRVGTVGRARFRQQGCWVNNNAGAIVATKGAGDPQYVHLLLLGIDWSSVCSVTAQPFLNVGALLALEVPAPPVAEQRAIASVLFDTDEEIAAVEIRRDKTRLIKQGMMQQLLTGRTRLVEAAP